MLNSKKTPAFTPAELDALWFRTLDEIERDGRTHVIRLTADLMRRTTDPKHLEIFSRMLEAEGSKTSRHHFTLLHSVNLLRRGKPHERMAVR